MKLSTLFFVLSLMLVSCTTRPVSPSKESRRAIDTIYQARVKDIQPELDSLCAFLFDSIYTVAKDSILNERTDEMNKLVQ